jgi:hypothetical protein
LLLATFAVLDTAAGVKRDRDGDRLPDRWEKRFRLSTKLPSGRKDADGDRLRNRREFRLRTNPRKKDTDRDRLGDRAEVRRFRTNPRKRDTDGDRLGDRKEIRRFRTNPRRKDTDRDGLGDRKEIRRFRTNPRKKDTDGDGFSDLVEIRAGTNPRSRRSRPRRPRPPAVLLDLPACTRHAGTATFGGELAAATPGQVICLAAGDYGRFTGTNKAITIRPADGADVTMSLDLSGSEDGNFTINGARLSFAAPTGLTITGASITGPVHDVTIKHSRFTRGVVLRSHPHPNVVFDHNEHVGIPASDTGAIILPGGSQVHSGVTIRNSYFHDLDPDGIQTGPAINVLDNEFARLDPNRSSAHSDAIQLYCGCGAPGVGSLVKGNYAHDGEQGIVAFDGSGDHVIEDNVVWNFRVHGIVLGGDTPASHVRHNTVGGSGRNQIDCSSKSGFSPSQTAIYDNIAQYVGLSGAVNCTPSRNDHNMVRQSPGTGNFLGNPTFVGGPNPTTYAGFRLAPGSPGKNAASNGQDIGIR